MVLLGLSSVLLVPSLCTNEVELRRMLFHERTYDQKVCPEAGITKVHTNLILLQIESVNEKEQVRLFFSSFAPNPPMPIV